MTLPKPECRAFVIQRILKKIDQDKSKKLLELGFGKGELLNLLKRNGYDIVGMEISRQAYDYVREKHPQLKVYLGEKINEKFDIVLSISLLEHIKNDLKALRKWRRLIKEGGYLIVAVPSKPEIFSQWNGFYGHYRRYDKKGLTALLEKAEYNIVYFYSYGYPLINIAQKYKMKKIKNLKMKRTREEKKRASGFMHRPEGFLNRVLINRLTILPFLYLQLLFLNKDKSTGYLVLCRKENLKKL